MERTFHVGYESEVQFEVNKDDYIFKGLEAVSQSDKETSRADCVEFNEISKDDKKGIYKYNVKLLKESKDVLIRPVCIALPKITEILPKFESSGCDQDTAIQITFNKAVDPETFKPEFISIFADEDLSQYFNTPQFTSDKKTLYISPKEIILNPNETKNFLNIEVDYDFTSLNDTDGLTFTAQGIHSYKINKSFSDQKTVVVKTQTEDVYGKFLSSEEKECTVGYSIDIQFMLKQQDYKFENFVPVITDGSTETAADCVIFENEEYDDQNGSYKASVKLTKALNDKEYIVIRPECKLLPKILDIYPPFDPNGYDQDSTIQITFNTPMDEDSFMNFSELQMRMGDGSNLTGFYDTPYFSADKTILNIPTKKNCNIIDANKDTEYADISITLPSSIKDINGIIVKNLQPYTYRINKNIDIIKPVISSLKVYSTSNTNDFFYRELTDKPFEEWTDDDFYCNVVYKPYICIQGYDNHSGIKKIHIKETLERNSSDVEQTGLVYEADYGIDSFVPVMNQKGEPEYNSAGNPLVQYAFEYDFKSSITGLVLLEISVIDNSENESNVSKFEMLEYKTKLNGDHVSSEITDTENGSKKLSFKSYGTYINGGFFAIPDIFFNKKPQQNKYTFANRERILSIDIYEEGGVHHLIKDKEKCIELTSPIILGWINEYFDSYVYTGEKPIYFKFNYEDQSAYEKEFITALPASPNAILIYDNDKNPIDIKPTTEYQNLNISYNGGNTTLYYTYQQNASSAESEKTVIWLSNTPLPSFLDGKENGIYRFYYRRSVSLEGSGLSSLTGEYGKPAVYYKGIENPYFTENVPFPDFSIPEDLITYERNSGKAKVTVNVTFPQNEYKYFIQARSAKANTTDNYFSIEKTFEIPSGETYYFSLVAQDVNGNIIATSTETQVLLNKVDNHSPKINYSPDLKEVDSNHLALSYPKTAKKACDVNINNEEEQSIKAIDIFFVPKGQGVKGLVHADEVTSPYYQRITVPFDYTSNSLLVPIDGFREGSYTDYLLFIQDDSKLNNYNWSSYSVNNEFWIYYTNLKPEVSINSNEMTIVSKEYKDEYCPTILDSNHRGYLKFKATNNNIYNNRVVEEYLDKQTNEWVYFTTKDNYDVVNYTTVMNYDSDNKYFNYTKDISSDGFQKNTFHKINTCFVGSRSGIKVYFRPVYIYPDYLIYKGTGEPKEIECHETSWLKVQNGYHVFCDAPCFVHTMYSSVQLTKTNTVDDAAEWEARALETGIASSDGYYFTYTDDNLKKIPDGYYYTTIIHFVDGTVLMSGVMQK